jgi:predicted O-methyltransferase YrrM
MVIPAVRRLLAARYKNTPVGDALVRAYIRLEAARDRGRAAARRLTARCWSWLRRRPREFLRRITTVDQRRVRYWAHLPARARYAFRDYPARTALIARWLVQSRELANFTYDLRDSNKAYLAHTVAVATGAEVATIRRYIDELEKDEALRAFIAERVRETSLCYAADEEARYGRRLGWYAMARTLKPRTVVETGVDKGLGAAVLCAALLRNAAEGAPGRYYGTEINRNSGQLLAGAYAETGEILWGDSLESLNALPGPIDLFINDSDHSAEYERREYEAVAAKLAPNAVIIGDNCHVTDVLATFSEAQGRRFLYFREEPRHWYRGAGMGISYR